MILAFACDDEKGLDGVVAYHFGRCPYYTFVEVEENKTKDVKVEKTSFLDSHQPGDVPNYIAQHRANVIFTGGMGPKAQDYFSSLGVKPVTGVYGRVEDVLNILRKIDESEESARNYFKKNQVPFSRAQYYTYRRTLQKDGEEGLHDKRKDGNYTKLTERMKDCLVSIVKENRSISSSQLQSKIVDRFGVKISVSSLNNFRASVSLTRLPASREQYKRQKSGGGEILTSLAFATHISELFTRTILDRVNGVCQSTVLEQNKNVEKDHSDTRLHGKFTKEYNQLKHVRENRFRSIDDKIKDKDFSSMKIFKTSEKAISRYNLALLCLPLVTSNGKSSRVNRVRGNDLSFLCGYNYKDASLDRYIQELKYLKVSDRLIIATAKFWMDFWRNESEDETYFVCYYIDGNTKALWSSNRCYKGRVTMPGSRHELSRKRVYP